MQNISGIGIWVGFSIFVVVALSLDTFLSKKHKNFGPDASMRASLCWTLLCVLYDLSSIPSFDTLSKTRVHLWDLECCYLSTDFNYAGHLFGRAFSFYSLYPWIIFNINWI